MTIPEKYSFERYLTAKKSVDDRALHQGVRQALAAHMPPSSRENPWRVLEVGAGVGTMIERLWESHLFGYARYTALDLEIDNLLAGWERLEGWFRRREDVQSVFSGEDLEIEGKRRGLEVRFLAADIQEYMDRCSESFDLLIANAFLDLVDVEAVLPSLLGLLRPGGLFYFTINFDGMTHFEPEIDPFLDARVEELYHRTMDERITNGMISGDSRIGRHLFGHLRSCGAEVLEVGASDWVVFPGKNGYPEDEAYFMHFILHTVHQALQGHPELDADEFAAWVARRHQQVEHRELVYIAHQIDFLGRVD